MTNTAIFDIDGTLANIDHRRDLVRGKNRNWPHFNRLMSADSLNEDIALVLDMFRSSGWNILIASGRGEEDRGKTVAWLSEHSINYEQLYMRPAKDYRKDSIIKEEILDKMIADGWNPTVVFDDRDQVVAMWRKRGLRCFQVADGNF